MANKCLELIFSQNWPNENFFSFILPLEYIILVYIEISDFGIAYCGFKFTFLFFGKNYLEKVIIFAC